jgi:hypothetical protein
MWNMVVFLGIGFDVLAYEQCGSAQGMFCTGVETKFLNGSYSILCRFLKKQTKIFKFMCVISQPCFLIWRGYWHNVIK